jgi:protein-tyrosine phosphatase
MAEVLFKNYLRQKGITDAWRVESAGVWAMAGAPATALAREVMGDRGLDLTFHRSQGISADLLREFDLILVMEDRHLRSLQRNFPEFAEKIFLFTSMVDADGDVEDPVWGTKETYLATVDELQDLLKRGFERIMSLSM